MGIKAKMNVAKVKLHGKAPAICIIGGVVAFVTAVVSGCKATTKLPKTMEEIHDDFRETRRERDKLTKNQYARKLIKTYGKSGWRLVKLYGVTFILTASGTILVLTGHIKWKKLAGEAAASAKAFETLYKQYRKAVVDKYGEEVDAKLAEGGIKGDDITIIDDKGDGKPKTYKETLFSASAEEDLYNYWLDERSRLWKPDKDYVFEQLHFYEGAFNRKFLVNHLLFLNEVTDTLDIRRNGEDVFGSTVTPEGQCIGWVLDKNNPVGDNHISFNLKYMYKKDPVTGKLSDRKYWHISLNCDGYILDRMNEI
jgi:hypothetical protein